MADAALKQIASGDPKSRLKKGTKTVEKNVLPTKAGNVSSLSFFPFIYIFAIYSVLHTHFIFKKFIFLDLQAEKTAGGAAPAKAAAAPAKKK